MLTNIFNKLKKKTETFISKVELNKVISKEKSSEITFKSQNYKLIKSAGVYKQIYREKSLISIYRDIESLKEKFKLDLEKRIIELERKDVKCSVNLLGIKRYEESISVIITPITIDLKELNTLFIKKNLKTLEEIDFRTRCEEYIEKIKKKDMKQLIKRFEGAKIRVYKRFTLALNEAMEIYIHSKQLELKKKLELLQKEVINKKKDIIYLDSIYYEKIDLYEKDILITRENFIKSIELLYEASKNLETIDIFKKNIKSFEVKKPFEKSNEFCNKIKELVFKYLETQFIGLEDKLILLANKISNSNILELEHLFKKLKKGVTKSHTFEEFCFSEVLYENSSKSTLTKFLTEKNTLEKDQTKLITTNYFLYLKNNTRKEKISIALKKSEIKVRKKLDEIDIYIEEKKHLYIKLKKEIEKLEQSLEVGILYNKNLKKLKLLEAYLYSKRIKNNFDFDFKTTDLKIFDFNYLKSDIKRYNFLIKSLKEEEEKFNNFSVQLKYKLDILINLEINKKEDKLKNLNKKIEKELKEEKHTNKKENKDVLSEISKSLQVFEKRYSKILDENSMERLNLIRKNISVYVKDLNQVELYFLQKLKLEGIKIELEKEMKKLKLNSQKLNFLFHSSKSKKIDEIIRSSKTVFKFDFFKEKNLLNELKNLKNLLNKLEEIEIQTRKN